MKQLLLILISFISVTFLFSQNLISKLNYSPSNLNSVQNLNYTRILNSNLMTNHSFVTVGNLKNALSGTTLNLNLNQFNLGILNFKAKKINYQTEANYFWYGEANTSNGEAASISLQSVNNSKLIEMQIGTRVYEIQDLQDDILLLGDVTGDDELEEPWDCDTEKIDSISSNNVIANSNNNLPQALRILPCDGALENKVKIMILYTQKALDCEGSNIQNRAILCMNQFNTALTNSLIPYQAELAHVGFLSGFTETGNSETSIFGFRNNIGMLNLRNFYKADIVILLTDGNWGNTQGTASVPPNPSNSFALVNVRKSTNLKIFCHEVGHLFGCAHGGTGIHPTWAGTNAKGFGIDRGTLRRACYSLVASAGRPNTRPLYFSNPNVSYVGYNFGETNANNAEQINTQWINRANWMSTPPVNNYEVKLEQENINCSSAEVVIKCGVGPYAITWDWSYSGVDDWQPLTSTWGSNGDYVSLGDIPVSSFQVAVVRVTVTDGNGLVKQSQAFHGPCGDPQGKLANNKIINDLKVMPNPTQGTTNLYFNINNDGLVEIQIYNAMGYPVKNLSPIFVKKGAFSKALNLSTIPKGNYIVKVKSKTETQSVQIRIN